MDAAFDILIQVTESLAPFQFKSREYEWDGVIHPQGDPVCVAGSFVLSKIKYPGYILSPLPADYQNESWQCVSISGEGLNLLNGPITGMTDEANIVKKSLYNLLCGLLSNKSKWVVHFSPGYDRLDEVKQGSVKDVFEKLISSLQVESRGFTVWY